MNALLEFLDSEEYGEAAYYELLRFDKRPEQLGTDALPWVAAKIILKFAPDDSPLKTLVNPDVVWDLHAQLLAETVDTLRWLRWAKTTAAQHHRDQPEPIPRPGVEAKEVIGEAMEMEELDALLGWN
ncbi:DUF5361 domain-containing protein [Rhodococcoides fascians]|uniref:DUF5361 domain-containing protein n=1 Tax=Rhodococcoides fascians TaxID=1828 RepID=UPI000562B707|nr:DUF5361 domain-containing protein [Rhodococcus fascians]